MSDWYYSALLTSRLRLHDHNSKKPGWSILPGQVVPLPEQGHYSQARYPVLTWELVAFKLVTGEDGETFVCVAGEKPVRFTDAADRFGALPAGYGHFTNFLTAGDCLRGFPCGWLSLGGQKIFISELSDLSQFVSSALAATQRQALLDASPVGKGIPQFFWVTNKPGEAPPKICRKPATILYDVFRGELVEAWRLPSVSNYRQNSYPSYLPRASRGYLACGLVGEPDEIRNPYEKDVWNNGWSWCPVTEHSNGLQDVLSAFTGGRTSIVVNS